MDEQKSTTKIYKKKESKATPHVSTKHLTLSAYHRVVQIVTNDNNELRPEEESQKSTYDYSNDYFLNNGHLLFQYYETKNKSIADEMFEHANIINDVSRTGNLYGKLFAIKDMQIYLLEQEKLLKEQIEREENNE